MKESKPISFLCKECNYCAKSEIHSLHVPRQQQSDILILHDQYDMLHHNEVVTRINTRFETMLSALFTNYKFLGKDINETITRAYAIKSNLQLKDGYVNPITNQEVHVFDKITPCVEKWLVHEVAKIKPKLILNFGVHNLGMQHLLGKIRFLTKGELYEKDGIYYIALDAMDEILNVSIRDCYNNKLREAIVQITMAISIVNNLEHDNEQTKELFNDYEDI